MSAADEHAETALLQDVDVVVVGVPHRPPARVSSRLFALVAVDALTMAARPVVIRLVLDRLPPENSPILKFHQSTSVV